MHLEDYKPIPSTQEINWADLDDDFESHFRQLGLIDTKQEEEDKKKEDGSEFISSLKN